MKISQSQPAPFAMSRLCNAVARGALISRIAHRPVKPSATELERPIDVAVQALCTSWLHDLDEDNFELALELQDRCQVRFTSHDTCLRAGTDIS